MQGDEPAQPVKQPQDALTVREYIKVAAALFRISENMEQDRHGTLEQIRAVWKDWQINPDKLRASQAMVKVGVILVKADAQEQRLKTISEDACPAREVAGL